MVYKIKRSDIMKSQEVVDEVTGFLLNFLDYADEDQEDYISRLIKELDTLQELLNIK